MNTRELFKLAAQTKDAQEFKALARKIADVVGERDEYGVYFIKPAFQTKTSDALKPPSPIWPDNYFEHVQTRKYIEAFLNEFQIKYLNSNLRVTAQISDDKTRELRELKK